MKLPTEADIAEMKVSGWDILVINEARKRLALRPIADELCRAIEAAFADVKLDGGIGLHEAAAIEDYCAEESLAAFRATDEKEDWRRIPVEALNRHVGTPSFFDAKGWQFHLPAYLIADLRGEYRFYLLDYLVKPLEYMRENLAMLSPKQRRVVRAYLQLHADDPEYAGYRESILEALEGFWAEPDSA